MEKQKGNYMKLKKVYNGFMAYLLANSLAIVITIPIIKLVGINADIPMWSILVGFVLGAFITWRIKCNSPKGFFLKNWFGCLFTGILIAIKITLLFMIITIPLSLRIATQCYYTGYDEMGREIWLKHIEHNTYEDVNGKRYTMK